MPSVEAETPRKMLPPPMTMPTSTPSSMTSFTSPAICCKVLGEMPYFPSPISASPLSLRRMRLNRGCRDGAVTGRGSYLAPRGRSRTRRQSVRVVWKPLVGRRAGQPREHLQFHQWLELDVHGARLELLESARRGQKAAVE